MTATLAVALSFFTVAVPSAWAHRPHDIVSQVELSPDFANDRTVFVEVRGNLCKSTDGGDRWQRLVKGLDNRNQPQGLVVSQQTADILYLAIELVRLEALVE
ncbi:MAG: hypothetical protein HC838_02555 [Spirulinaceae cyanobacterium RM2_2_10]|nr:hypothetical protein [Spirulinaceae cyanobacterium SM2_1_0]NJO19166.1 hypothetical protein [Spirulinaceae cyanobacterium RM2_2_10]